MTNNGVRYYCVVVHKPVRIEVWRERDVDATGGALVPLQNGAVIPVYAQQLVVAAIEVAVGAACTTFLPAPPFLLLIIRIYSLKKDYFLKA